MTTTALIPPALVVLALAAAYAIVCMAILVAEQRRIIDALEADARRTSETLAERNLTVESPRMTIRKMAMKQSGLSKATLEIIENALRHYLTIRPSFASTPGEQLRLDGEHRVAVSDALDELRAFTAQQKR